MVTQTSKGDGKDGYVLKGNGRCRRVKWQWKSLMGSEEALKGNDEALKDNKEALKVGEETLKSDRMC